MTLYQLSWTICVRFVCGGFRTVSIFTHEFSCKSSKHWIEDKMPYLEILKNSKLVFYRLDTEGKI